MASVVPFAPKPIKTAFTLAIDAAKKAKVQRTSGGALGGAIAVAGKKGTGTGGNGAAPTGGALAGAIATVQEKKPVPDVSPEVSFLRPEERERVGLPPRVAPASFSIFEPDKPPTIEGLRLKDVPKRRISEIIPQTKPRGTIERRLASAALIGESGVLQLQSKRLDKLLEEGKTEEFNSRVVEFNERVRAFQAKVRKEERQFAQEAVTTASVQREAELERKEQVKERFAPKLELVAKDIEEAFRENIRVSAVPAFELAPVTGGLSIPTGVLASGVLAVGAGVGSAARRTLFFEGIKIPPEQRTFSEENLMLVSELAGVGAEVITFVGAERALARSLAKEPFVFTAEAEAISKVSPAADVTRAESALIAEGRISQPLIKTRDIRIAGILDEQSAAFKQGKEIFEETAALRLGQRTGTRDITKVPKELKEFLEPVTIKTDARLLTQVKGVKGTKVSVGAGTTVERALDVKALEAGAESLVVTRGKGVTAFAGKELKGAKQILTIDSDFTRGVRATRFDKGLGGVAKQASEFRATTPKIKIKGTITAKTAFFEPVKAPELIGARPTSALKGATQLERTVLKEGEKLASAGEQIGVKAVEKAEALAPAVSKEAAKLEKTFAGALSTATTKATKISKQVTVPFSKLGIVGKTSTLPLVGFKQKAGTKVKEATLTGVTTKQAEKTISGLKEATLVGTISSIKTAELPAFKTATTTDVVVSTATAQKEAEAVMFKTLTKTKAVQRAAVTTPVPRVPLPKIPRTPIPILFPLPSGGETIRGTGLIGKVQGFIPTVKTRGKWLKASTRPLTKNQALRLGANIADNTTSQSFRVRKVKKKAVRPAFDILPNLMKFRFSKKQKAYTEKPKARIDTIGEIFGIPYAGLKKLRAFPELRKPKRKRRRK